MKGYKGFNKDFTCRGKQYQENTVFEEEKLDICHKGMHFCENPFEVLEHYDLVNNDGSFNEFAEVEALGEVQSDDEGKKYCTTKLRVGAKLGFAGFINACVDFALDKTKVEDADIQERIKNTNLLSDNGGDSAQIGSSGYSAKIGSSGNSAKIGSSGNSAKIGSSGDYAQIGSSGNSAKIGSSGDYAQIGSSGDSAQIGSSGNYAQIGSSGNYAQIGSSGYSAKIGSSGNYAQIGSSGNYAQIGSSGDYAKITSTGEDAVICCAGTDSVVKAKVGSWITLAEWVWSEEKNRYVPKCVKTEYVDGERIKADTAYILKDGIFTEYEED